MMMTIQDDLKTQNLLAGRLFHDGLLRQCEEMITQHGDDE